MSHIVTTPCRAGNDETDSGQLSRERRCRRMLKRRLARSERRVELLKKRLARALVDANQWESHALWLSQLQREEIE